MSQEGWVAVACVGCFLAMFGGIAAVCFVDYQGKEALARQSVECLKAGGEWVEAECRRKR